MSNNIKAYTSSVKYSLLITLMLVMPVLASNNCDPSEARIDPNTGRLIIANNCQPPLSQQTNWGSAPQQANVNFDPFWLLLVLRAVTCALACAFSISFVIFATMATVYLSKSMLGTHDSKALKRVSMKLYLMSFLFVILTIINGALMLVI